MKAEDGESDPAFPGPPNLEVKPAFRVALVLRALRIGGSP